MTVTVLAWSSSSELAFVRDCFYPHHVSSSSSSSLSYAAATSTHDIYAAPPLEDTNSTEFKSRSQQDFQARFSGFKAGLDRVAVWNFRSPRNVPHAVSATAGFIDAMVHDEAFGVDDGESVVLGKNDDDDMGSTGFTMSETAMKSIYAMAFIRFVNGFVDRDVSRDGRRTGLSKVSTAPFGEDDEDDEDDERDRADRGSLATSIAKSMGESSMYAYAVRIGMPVSFVDLRHRCVHGEVPGLGVLRGMCRRGLEWLWERWWRGNAIGDGGRWVWEVEQRRNETSMSAVMVGEGEKEEKGDGYTRDGLMGHGIELDER